MKNLTIKEMSEQRYLKLGIRRKMKEIAWMDRNEDKLYLYSEMLKLERKLMELGV